MTNGRSKNLALYLRHEVNSMGLIIDRIRIAFITLPRRKDWLYTLGLLIAFVIVYLPIGFSLGFLAIDPRLDFWTIVGVLPGTLLMPGINEELIFRSLLIPHPTEAVPRQKQREFVALSWVLFLLYHIHPWTPPFFKTPAFLIGAALIGVVCTISYLRSRSIWTAIVLHWLIVVGWLLIFGGLRKFQG
jgi:predicted Abi (CAAX) family protease